LPADEVERLLTEGATLNLNEAERDALDYLQDIAHR
jgi:hypothetical protein